MLPRHTSGRQDRLDVLDAIQAADLKVLRLFISATSANCKNTGSVDMLDIEPKEVGTYDDTQLEAIDQLMVEAHERGKQHFSNCLEAFGLTGFLGIKFAIAMHDRYQLGCWGNDTYVQKYNLPATNCAFGTVKENNITSWYGNTDAISDFENRIKHILEHRNAPIE